MTQEPENIIASYTDAEALEDGVLVAFDASPVNRVTRAVFDHFTQPLGTREIGGPPVIDLNPLQWAIEATVAWKPDKDGWRCGSYEGMELWLVPNEVNGLTLMFPEDY